MIKIERTPKPRILHQKGVDWTNELCEARRQYYVDLKKYESGELSNKPTRPNAKSGRYAHDEITHALRGMFGTKCAYCESTVTAVSYQHVEHFRPQSIYPRLAYEWNNLLLACEVCNSGNKINKFPLCDGRQPQPDASSPCSLDDSDDNALVNPCVDDPAKFFDFDGANLVCLNARAKATRDICGLNREDLIDARRKRLIEIRAIVKAFLLFKQLEMEKECKEFAYRLKSLIDVSAQYSAMARSELIASKIDIVWLLNL